MLKTKATKTANEKVANRSRWSRERCSRNWIGWRKLWKHMQLPYNGCDNDSCCVSCESMEGRGEGCEDIVGVCEALLSRMRAVPIEH